MVFNFLYCWLAFIIILVLCVYFLSKQISTALGSILYMWIVAFLPTALIAWITPHVTIISQDKKHETFLVLGASSVTMDGKEYSLPDLSYTESYLYNDTQMDLVLYPQQYGEGNADLSDSDIKYISVGQCIATGHTPDYYFEVPESVSVSQNRIWSIILDICGQNYEVKWILDKH